MDLEAVINTGWWAVCTRTRAQFVDASLMQLASMQLDPLRRKLRSLFYRTVLAMPYFRASGRDMLVLAWSCPSVSLYQLSLQS